jgi:hypothetical protein
MGQSGLFVQVVPLQRLRAIAAISRRTAARRVLHGLRANVANKAYHKNKTQIDAATKIEVRQHYDNYTVDCCCDVLVLKAILIGSTRHI